MIKVLDKNGLKGVIKEEGKDEFKTIVPFEYNDIKIINDEFLLLKLKDSFYGVYSLKLNKKIIDCNADRIVFYDNVIEAQFECALFDATHQYTIGKTEIYNHEGKEIISCDYDFISDNIDNHYICMKDDKCGIVNDFNKVIVPFEYDNIEIVDGKDINSIIFEKEKSSSSTYSLKSFLGISKMITRNNINFK